MTAPKGDPLARAYSAWFRHCADRGIRPDQPADTSAIHTVDDRDYVVLENANGILAVYRITNQGQLKRLQRWPSSLNFPTHV